MSYVHGKICYVEIPAGDVEQSAAFYRAVFGWKTRTRGDGSLAFDDGLGETSGTWERGRPPHEGGLGLYIMVDDVDATVAAVGKHGGAIVDPVTVMGPMRIARFRDPHGNVFGLYQGPRES